MKIHHNLCSNEIVENASSEKQTISENNNLVHETNTESESSISVSTSEYEPTDLSSDEMPIETNEMPIETNAIDDFGLSDESSEYEELTESSINEIPTNETPSTVRMEDLNLENAFANGLSSQNAFEKDGSLVD